MDTDNRDISITEALQILQLKSIPADQLMKIADKLVHMDIMINHQRQYISNLENCNKQLMDRRKW